MFFRYTGVGQVAEWSKARAWKVRRRVTVSRVRIPSCPPPIRPRNYQFYAWVGRPAQYQRPRAPSQAERYLCGMVTFGHGILLGADRYFAQRGTDQQFKGLWHPSGVDVNTGAFVPPMAFQLTGCFVAGRFRCWIYECAAQV